MLCSTGIVNEILVGKVCKIITFPLKQQRSHPGEELARLVKRRLIKDGVLGLSEIQLGRARASCFPWKLVNEHDRCFHFAQSAVAQFSWKGICAGCCPSFPGLAG